MPHHASPATHFWLLDTRPLWPGANITTSAASILPLIAPSERSRAQSFHFHRDAKTSLASALLKRLFACRGAGQAWGGARFGRAGDPRHGKPCLLLPSSSAALRVDFNVSHQAGVVLLAGATTTTTAEGRVALGVDVTCVAERKPPTLLRDGFAAFVDMHVDAFSDADIAAIKDARHAAYAEPREPAAASASAASSSEAAETAAAKEEAEQMRRFYAFWALKEAYIKLEGEALLAPWLRDVEFRNVRLPALPRDGEEYGRAEGGIEVWIRGVRREDVEVWVQAWGEEYIIATAVLVEGGGQGEERERVVPRWQTLDLERDVLPSAQRIDDE